MAIEGSSLEPLRKMAQELASRGFRREILLALAEEARRQVVKGFEKSVDPEGHAWLGLKYRQGLPLVNTGRLRNSIRFVATSNGIMGSTNVSYAAIQNYGGRAGRGGKAVIPGRQFLPDKLGPVWAGAFERTIKEMVRRRIR